MKRIIISLIATSFTFLLSLIALSLYSLTSVPTLAEPAILADSNLPPANINLDTSFSAPKDWKVIDEPKWGFRLSVPPALNEKDFEGRNWVHESNNLRVVVAFGKHPSQKELGLKKNYSQTILRVNNLKALLAVYEEEAKSDQKHFPKTAMLMFLDNPERLGNSHPLFRVEYAEDKDLKTALQILQTVSFYNP